MSSGEQRRSTRVLELEAKRSQQAVNKKKPGMDLVRLGRKSIHRQRNKKSKVSRPLSRKATNLVEAVTVSTETPFPQTSALSLLVDIIKRRDARKIFAEPVNAAEVIGYDNIIEKPMDLATISTKLRKGKYKILEEFEDDVYLIFNNAMLFNGSNTVYYRQARAIKEVAMKLFAALRANTHNFEFQFALVGLGINGWTNADSRLLNSITGNLLKKSTTAEKLESTAAGKSDGSLHWNSYPTGKFVTQNFSEENSSANFYGGSGPVARMVAQPNFGNSNHGATIPWQNPSHHQPQLPNQQYISSTTYYGTDPGPSNRANPFTSNQANFYGCSGPVARMVAQPNFGNCNHGATIPWQPPSHHQPQLPNQHRIPSTTYYGTDPGPSNRTNPFTSNPGFPNQVENAPRDVPDYRNLPPRSVFADMSLDDIIKYIRKW